MIDLHTTQVNLPGPLYFMEGKHPLLCPVSLKTQVDYTIDADGNVTIVEVFAQTATVKVAGVEVEALAESDEFLRRFRAAPINRDRFVEEVERVEFVHLPDECPDPAYQRMAANGRLIARNGRDCS